ncbi:hypothetical protein U3516DRAFT_553567 [Neocallimastix sp. 'constans']
MFLLNFTSTDIKVVNPISINFQLFDIMLSSYDLCPYLHTNDANKLIRNQTNLVIK